MVFVFVLLFKTVVPYLLGDTVFLANKDALQAIVRLKGRLKVLEGLNNNNNKINNSVTQVFQQEPLGEKTDSFFS